MIIATAKIGLPPSEIAKREPISHTNSWLLQISLMRTITNDYRDAQISNLGSGGERGPYLVTQTGVAPSDPIPKTRMFVLRPDGRWVDFNAYACQGKPEAIDEIVFSTTPEVMETFAKLFGSASGARPACR